MTMGSIASNPASSNPGELPPVRIRLDGVRKSYAAASGVTPAVDGVSLEVRAGEFVALLGPSGCGKSTILNLVAGLDTPDDGTVTYDGVRIQAPHSQVGYLTQDDALLPWRSVTANVALPLEIRKFGRSAREERAREVLDRVGLSGFGRHFPHQLSGGMRKRASLARNLIYNPQTLLLDEPFGALDAFTRASMQRELLTLVRQSGLSVLLVTHDLDEAILLADKIVLFSRRPARILETFDLPKRPLDEFDSRTPGDDVLHRVLWNRLSGGESVVT